MRDECPQAHTRVDVPNLRANASIDRSNDDAGFRYFQSAIVRSTDQQRFRKKFHRSNAFAVSDQRLMDFAGFQEPNVNRSIETSRGQMNVIAANAKDSEIEANE